MSFSFPRVLARLRAKRLRFGVKRINNVKKCRKFDVIVSDFDIAKTRKVWYNKLYKGD